MIGCENDKQNFYQERNLAIDIAKGIGILLVVFAHVNYTPALLTYIYSFHMPLFFVISGMLFRKEKYRSFGVFLKRKFITLICPYLFFYMVAMIIRFGIDTIRYGISDTLIEEYLNFFLEMFIAQKSATVISAPLWFVPCLFLVEIVYYFVAKLKSYLIVLVCSILVFVGWLWESPYGIFENIITIWSVDSALFAIGFYALGNLTIDKVDYFIDMLGKCKYKNIIIGAGTLLCMLFLISIAFLNGKVSLGSKILNNGLLFYLSGILGFIGIFLISSMIKENKFLVFCGRNSFCIMSTHHLIRSILVNGCELVGLEAYDNTKIVETIIPFIIVLVLSLICTLMYNKGKMLLMSSVVQANVLK